MTLLLFILILSILVFVHEFGHFWAAKKAGVKVEEFGFGLPPRIWSKKVKGTIYSINALPIGGFVRLYGEDGGGGDQFKVQSSKFKVDGGKAYFEVSLARRLSVLFAGVTMNLILAIVCFSVLYFFLGIPTKTGKVKIEGVVENSPAEQAGLVIDDEIVLVNGVALKSTEDFINVSKQNAGKLMELEVKREKDNPCKREKEIESGVLGGAITAELLSECRGENLLRYLTPRENPPAGEGPLGVVISDTEMKKYPFYIMPFLGIREGFKESWAWGKEIYFSMKKMLAQLIFQGKVPKDIAGPVGIFQITGQAAKHGALAVFQFVGILSVNLAMMNVLPLPALDGGRVVFLAYEAISKKKASPKVEMAVNNIGMLVLLTLMLLITVNDVMRLINK